MLFKSIYTQDLERSQRMRRFMLISVLLLVLHALGGCSEDRGLDPQITADSPSPAMSVDPELVAKEIVAKVGWPAQAVDGEAVDAAEMEIETPGYIINMNRQPIVGDVVHYSFQLSIGPGPYDVIGLHRVVREKQACTPIRTKKTLFALHGTPGHFEVMFLAGSVIPSAPDDQSIAVYLAQHDVDVWGIDQAYTLLPEGITDFSFMEGWGIQFDAENLRTGMDIARFVRMTTGNGFGKMNLMGYSTGLMTGIAALNMETQLPDSKRHIGGFIAVDYFYKTLDPDWLQSECKYAQYVNKLLETGVYQQDFGLVFQTIGFLAETDPEGHSPIMPRFTNMEMALFAAAYTGAFFGLPGDVHFLAGIFDESGNAVDLRYTELTHYIEWLQQFNNYGSNFLEYDIAVLHCNEEDSPHDDYLEEIDIPVFFMGANGGWGDMMDHTASLLGSDDVTMLNVQLQPEKILDIGHVDIFTAGNAQQEFWAPVLEWINDHTSSGKHD
jgi:pimeloyl-ACP methyl ester carboxylesterase